jgi:hypothetical protein
MACGASLADQAGEPTNNDPVRRSLLFSSKSLAPVSDSVQDQGFAGQQGFA